MNTRSLQLLLTGLVATTVACSDPPRGGGGTDTDSGNGTDTPAVDTGTPTDRGNTDTGNTTDTGVDGGMKTGDVGNTDSGTPTDGGGSMDGGARDGSTPDATPLPDVSGPYNPCAAGSVIDLNAMGMRMGEVTRISGNNTNVPPGAPLPSLCVPTAGHLVAYRYVPRATTRLRISTDNAGSGTTLDTVVFVQNMCAPSTVSDGGVASDSLGCNDDNGVTGTTRPYTSLLTSAVVTMGQPVYIIVGGYLNAMGQPYMNNLPRGPFELSVTELATAQTGGACTVDIVCPMGNTCIANPGSTTMGTCRVDGAMGGACRTAMPRCDGTGTCSSTTGAGICQATAMTGQPCDNTATVCATGNTCIIPTGMTSGTCRASGTAAGTACRTEGTRCDAPLECSTTTGSGTCRTVAAAGQPCGGSSIVCATGSSCVIPSGMTAGTCVTNGSASGAACRADAPRCDTGFTCTTTTGTGTCYREVAAGAACVPGNYAGDRCPVTAPCMPTTRTTGVCTAGVAETEPNNSPMMPQAAVAMSRVYSGSVEAMGQDCFGVTITQGQGIYAESNLPMNPTCPSGIDMDPIIRIYNPAGTALTSQDDTTGRGYCSIINPSTNTAANNLPAGNYTVCIADLNGGMLSNYLLTVGIYPAP